MEQIAFVQSDTALVPRGGGTGGSRSLQLGGSACARRPTACSTQARDVAARDCSRPTADDIVVTDGRRLRRAPACRGDAHVGEIAGAARGRRRAAGAELDFEPGRRDVPVRRPRRRRRGRPRHRPGDAVRHVAVDDCGRILNPLIVAGQQHGGSPRASRRRCGSRSVYDADGNPLTGDARRLRDADRGRAAHLRGDEHRDADPAQPARRQGHRRVGARSARPRRCRTPSSTRSRPSACATSTCRARRERVWRAVRDAQAGRPAQPWREPPAVFGTLPVRGRGPAADEGTI